MRDELTELAAMRKRGTRPQGPVVVTHSHKIASYYRDANRGMYTVLLGATERWNSLSGLDVMLVDWLGEARHRETGQAILDARPKFFVTSLWQNSRTDTMRNTKTAVLLQ